MKKGFELELNEGLRVWFRPVEPGDKDRLVQGLAQMSPEARYQRFFVPTAKLTAEQLRNFTEVDQRDHVAWIAVDPTSSTQRGLGIGRFVRVPEEPQVAEAAITVIDEVQHHGIGCCLLVILMVMGQKQGLRRLRAYILPENRASIHLFQKVCGFCKFIDNVMQVDLLLDETALPAASSPEGLAFREVLARVRAALN